MPALDPFFFAPQKTKRMASVMSTIEIIMGTVYVVSTIKSVVGSAQYVHSWYKWARKKKPEPTVEPWQWVENDDDFLIEATLEPFEGRGGR